MDVDEYLDRMSVVQDDVLEVCNDLHKGFKKKVTGAALDALLERGRRKLQDYHALLALLDEDRKAQANEEYGDSMQDVERLLKQLEEWAVNGT